MSWPGHKACHQREQQRCVQHPSQHSSSQHQMGVLTSTVAAGQCHPLLRLAQITRPAPVRALLLIWPCSVLPAAQSLTAATLMQVPGISSLWCDSSVASRLQPVRPASQLARQLLLCCDLEQQHKVAIANMSPHLELCRAGSFKGLL